MGSDQIHLGNGIFDAFQNDSLISIRTRSGRGQRREGARVIAVVPSYSLAGCTFSMTCGYCDANNKIKLPFRNSRPFLLNVLWNDFER